MSNFYEELIARGIVENISSPELIEQLNHKKIKFYIGYDPSAASLQLGNLFCIVTMKRFQNQGHIPYCVLGGATGMIGDPSGKSNERNLLSEETLLSNTEKIKNQLQSLLPNGHIVNNFDWTGKISFLHFLRDIGKRFRLSEMLAKDSVKSRLNSEVGISFTEFSYQILQAYDFSFLNKEHQVTLQLGGSDQWGNITAGIDLSRKMNGTEVFGMVIPLVVDQEGRKFGKSENNSAIYLDKNLTSPYKMYQFLLNVDDQMVLKLLHYYTFLPLSEIQELYTKHLATPHLRSAQKILALEVVKFVHGDAGVLSATHASNIFFGSEITHLKDKELLEIMDDIPSVTLKSELLTSDSFTIIDLFLTTTLFKGRGEVKRSIQEKGCYLNNKPIDDFNLIIKNEHLASESCLILRKGKKNYFVVKFIP